MALYKYHYIELDTKRSPRISLQNIVAGETGNRLWITVTNNGETIDMSEKEDGEYIYRVCLVIKSNLGVRRQDSATEDSGISFIDANTGDHGKINILLSKDSFTAGKNRARIEIYSKRVEEDDTLIVSAEWTFDVEGADEGDNVGLATPLLVEYEQSAKRYADIAEALFVGSVVEPSILDWMDTHSDETAVVIDDWLDEHPEATTTVQDGSITPVKLHETVGGLVEVPTEWTQVYADSTNPDASLTVINGYIRGSTASSPGKISASDSYRCYYFKATDDMYVYAVFSKTSRGMRVSNEQPVTGIGAGTAWTGNLYNNAIPTRADPALVLKDQYVAVSTVAQGSINIYYRPKVTSFALNEDVPLTDAMIAAVDAMINESADTGVSSDALLYVDKIPSYWISPADTPTSFDEARPYLENKIAQIPAGRSFLFITDVHWPGNQKHSTQLMQYIRKRTGIKPVLHGGDIYGQANTKYLATKVLGSYLYEARQAFREDFIPCVGDHDNNTVSQPDENFLPYVQLSPMFVNDLRGRAVFYEPSDKVAAMVESEADYNEIMAFFRTVFYVDDKSTKTRFISLNCGNAGTTGAVYDAFGTMGTEMIRTQIPFLIDALYETPEGYDVCVLAHKLSYASSSTNTILILLSDFKIKKANVKPSPASSTEAIEDWWDHASTYDFSDAPDIGLLYVLDGHQHIDKLTWAGYDRNSSWSRANAYNGTDELDQDEYGQIPCITTQTDSVGNQESGTAAMTAGTTTEQSFDVVTRVTDGIVLTRIGAGNNRRVYVT